MSIRENPSWTPFNTCKIGGFNIAVASRVSLAEAMVVDCLAARNSATGPRLVFDVNGQAISLRETNGAYRSAVDQADVIHADGGFLVAVSRWRNRTPIPERSATTDLIHDCAKAAAQSGLSFYLLGGTEQVNAECAQSLKALYPNLLISGRRHGYFSQSEEAAIIKEINRCRPDVLWVGLGKPFEQILSVRWRDALICGWLVTCGGCYNFITGHYARAPLWMQKYHLEWLFRAITTPKLLWRYIITSPHALWVALTK